MDDRTQVKTNLQDLRTHLQKLDQNKLLRRVTIPINKDTELMPLVRWQFRGLKEDQRTGFLFENVTNARGESLKGGVAVGITGGRRPLGTSGRSLSSGNASASCAAAWACRTSNTSM